MKPEVTYRNKKDALGKLYSLPGRPFFDIVGVPALKS